MKITTLKLTDNSEIFILAYSILQFTSYVLSPEKVHSSLEGQMIFLLNLLLHRQVQIETCVINFLSTAVSIFTYYIYCQKLTNSAPLSKILQLFLYIK